MTESRIDELLREYTASLRVMGEYLLVKLGEEDYHGVADACMDIREILARVGLLLEFKKEGLNAG